MEDDNNLDNIIGMGLEAVVSNNMQVIDNYATFLTTSDEKFRKIKEKLFNMEVMRYEKSFIEQILSDNDHLRKSREKLLELCRPLAQQNREYSKQLEALQRQCDNANRMCVAWKHAKDEMFLLYKNTEKELEEKTKKLEMTEKSLLQLRRLKNRKKKLKSDSSKKQENSADTDNVSSSTLTNNTTSPRLSSQLMENNPTSNNPKVPTISDDEISSDEDIPLNRLSISASQKSVPEHCGNSTVLSAISKEGNKTRTGSKSTASAAPTANETKSTELNAPSSRVESPKYSTSNDENMDNDPSSTNSSDHNFNCLNDRTSIFDPVFDSVDDFNVLIDASPERINSPSPRRIVSPEPQIPAEVNLGKNKFQTPFIPSSTSPQIQPSITLHPSKMKSPFKSPQSSKGNPVHRKNHESRKSLVPAVGRELRSTSRPSGSNRGVPFSKVSDHVQSAGRKLRSESRTLSESSKDGESIEELDLMTAFKRDARSGSRLSESSKDGESCEESDGVQAVGSDLESKSERISEISEEEESCNESNFVSPVGEGSRTRSTSKKLSSQDEKPRKVPDKLPQENTSRKIVNCDAKIKIDKPLETIFDDLYVSDSASSIGDEVAPLSQFSISASPSRAKEPLDKHYAHAVSPRKSLETEHIPWGNIEEEVKMVLEECCSRTESIGTQQIVTSDKSRKKTKRKRITTNSNAAKTKTDSPILISEDVKLLCPVLNEADLLESKFTKNDFADIFCINLDLQGISVSTPPDDTSMSDIGSPNIVTPPLSPISSVDTSPSPARSTVLSKLGISHPCSPCLSEDDDNTDSVITSPRVDYDESSHVDAVKFSMPEEILQDLTAPINNHLSCPPEEFSKNPLVHDEVFLPQCEKLKDVKAPDNSLPPNLPKESTIDSTALDAVAILDPPTEVTENSLACDDTKVTENSLACDDTKLNSSSEENVIVTDNTSALLSSEQISKDVFSLVSNMVLPSHNVTTVDVCESSKSTVIPSLNGSSNDLMATDSTASSSPFEETPKNIMTTHSDGITKDSLVSDGRIVLLACDVEALDSCLIASASEESLKKEVVFETAGVTSSSVNIAEKVPNLDEENTEVYARGRNTVLVCPSEDISKDAVLPPKILISAPSEEMDLPETIQDFDSDADEIIMSLIREEFLKIRPISPLLDFENEKELVPLTPSFEHVMAETEIRRTYTSIKDGTKEFETEPTSQLLDNVNEDSGIRLSHPCDREIEENGVGSVPVSLDDSSQEKNIEPVALSLDRITKKNGIKPVPSLLDKFTKRKKIKPVLPSPENVSKRNRNRSSTTMTDIVTKGTPLSSVTENVTEEKMLSPMKDDVAVEESSTSMTSRSPKEEVILPSSSLVSGNIDENGLIHAPTSSDGDVKEKGIKQVSSLLDKLTRRKKIKPVLPSPENISKRNRSRSSTAVQDVATKGESLSSVTDNVTEEKLLSPIKDEVAEESSTSRTYHSPKKEVILTSSSLVSGDIGENGLIRAPTSSEGVVKENGIKPVSSLLDELTEKKKIKPVLPSPENISKRNRSRSSPAMKDVATKGESLSFITDNVTEEKLLSPIKDAVAKEELSTSTTYDSPQEEVIKLTSSPIPGIIEENGLIYAPTLPNSVVKENGIKPVPSFPDKFTKRKRIKPVLPIVDCGSSRSRIKSLSSATENVITEDKSRLVPPPSDNVPEEKEISSAASVELQIGIAHTPPVSDKVTKGNGIKPEPSLLDKFTKRKRIKPVVSILKTDSKRNKIIAQSLNKDGVTDEAENRSLPPSLNGVTEEKETNTASSISGSSKENGIMHPPSPLKKGIKKNGLRPVSEPDNFSNRNGTSRVSSLQDNVTEKNGNRPSSLHSKNSAEECGVEHMSPSLNNVTDGNQIVSPSLASDVISQKTTPSNFDLDEGESEIELVNENSELPCNSLVLDLRSNFKTLLDYKIFKNTFSSQRCDFIPLIRSNEPSRPKVKEESTPDKPPIQKGSNRNSVAKKPSVKKRSTSSKTSAKSKSSPVIDSEIFTLSKSSEPPAKGDSDLLQNLDSCQPVSDERYSDSSDDAPILSKLLKARPQSSQKAQQMKSAAANAKKSARADSFANPCQLSDFQLQNLLELSEAENNASQAAFISTERILNDTINKGVKRKQSIVDNSVGSEEVELPPDLDGNFLASPKHPKLDSSPFDDSINEKYPRKYFQNSIMAPVKVCAKSNSSQITSKNNTKLETLLEKSSDPKLDTSPFHDFKDKHSTPKTSQKSIKAPVKMCLASNTLPRISRNNAKLKTPSVKASKPASNPKEDYSPSHISENKLSQNSFVSPVKICTVSHSSPSISKNNTILEASVEKSSIPAAKSKSDYSPFHVFENKHSQNSIVAPVKICSNSNSYPSTSKNNTKLETLEEKFSTPFPKPKLDPTPLPNFKNEISPSKHSQNSIVAPVKICTNSNSTPSVSENNAELGTPLEKPSTPTYNRVVALEEQIVLQQKLPATKSDHAPKNDLNFAEEGMDSCDSAPSSSNTEAPLKYSECENNCLWTCFKYYKDVHCKRVIENKKKGKPNFRRDIPKKSVTYLLSKLINPCLETWSEVASATVIQLMHTEEAAIIEYLLDFVEADISESNTTIHPNLRTTHQLLLVFCHKLAAVFPNVFDSVLKAVENRLLSAVGGSLMVFKVENLSIFFTIVCRSLNRLQRCRCFIYDALYMTKRKAYLIIHSVLSVWPQVFPRASQTEKCPLSTVVAYEILKNVSRSTKDMVKHNKELDDFKVEALKTLLYRSYGYPNPNEETDKVIKDKTVSTLTSMLDHPGCVEAFVLFAKREGWLWTANRLVLNHLIPLLQKFKKGGMKEATAVTVVRIIGLVTRASPVGTAWLETKRIIEALETFLFDVKLGSASFKEAVAISIVQLSRLDNNLCFSILAKWNPPTKTLSVEFLEEVKTLFYSKPLGAWNSQLRSINSNLPPS